MNSDLMAEVILVERDYWQSVYRDQLGDPAWEARANYRLGMIKGNPADVCFVRKARLERQPRRVLSAGCGTGNFIMSWLYHGANDSTVYGVDLSEKVLAIAWNKTRASNATDRVVLCCGTLEQLPWDDAFFDLVHCQDVMEHVSDPCAALRELLRVTRPGGQLFIHVPDYRLCYEPHYRVRINPCTKEEARRVLCGLGRPLGYLEHLNFINPLKIEQLVRRICPADEITRVGRPARNIVLWLYHRWTGLNYDLLIRRSEPWTGTE